MVNCSERSGGVRMSSDYNLLMWLEENVDRWCTLRYPWDFFGPDEARHTCDPHDFNIKGKCPVPNCDTHEWAWRVL